jgi:hypothetical protein
MIEHKAARPCARVRCRPGSKPRSRPAPTRLGLAICRRNGPVQDPTAPGGKGAKPLRSHNSYAAEQASRLQPQRSSNPLLSEARTPWPADRKPPPPADGTLWTAYGICRHRSLRLSFVRAALPSIEMARGLLGAYSWRRSCHRKHGHRSCKYECKREDNKGLHGRTPNSLSRDVTSAVFRPDFVGRSISFRAATAVGRRLRVALIY